MAKCKNCSSVIPTPPRNTAFSFCSWSCLKEYHPDAMLKCLSCDRYFLPTSSFDFCSELCKVKGDIIVREILELPQEYRKSYKVE